MKITFHPEAELELIEAAVFYDGQVPGLGGQLEAEVRRITSLLLENPEIGLLVDSQRRKFGLTRFPFSLIYVVSTDNICILAVAHQKRRPGYWQNRV